MERFDDDLDIGWMVRDASFTWIGPSPRVGQSRWGGAARARRQVGRALKLTAAGVAFTAVAFVSLVLAAVTVTPGATMAPVGKLTNGMSHVLAHGAVASPSQAPAIPASVPSPRSAPPRPGTAPLTGPPSTSKRGPGASPSPRATPHPTDE
jgi:hypothetical protein